jgi:hypothetical protein
MMQYSKLPQHVYAGHYLTATDISKVAVERLLRAVKSTSPSTDGLPCWFFQSCLVELVETVCHIFNCSVASGIVPSQWSNALVTLISKVHSPQHLGDLRPISDKTLFKSIQYNDHCLHSILPQVKLSQCNSRDCGHELSLPEYRTLLYKKSFMLRCLFETG